jgi:hydrogenase maturation protein HypF
MSGSRSRQARRISVTGVVQGVGFRPFVYQLAKQNALTGWVRNTSGDVTILVEGPRSSLERFLEQLKNGPPQAHIERISVSEEKPDNYAEFSIKESLAKENEYQLVSPDLATCPDCLKEILDPLDRRYRYPFTNCTNCGPRFTIIQDIPYDRPRTTMGVFKMCPRCQEEYDDPSDRRFHAQPNACPICGPHLELIDQDGRLQTGVDVISRAAGLLAEGKILAIKGLGGFLLACDARNDQAVKSLRERKHRPAKPLAVMLKDRAEVQKYCEIGPGEGELLASTASPIVLLKLNGACRLSPLVAPGLNYLGVMLPYTPLHHLLLRETDLPLVMTSGNLSEEPIAADNQEALERLRGIADYFVMHNREIYSRYDDSVSLVEKGSPRLARRARGYAPFPINLAVAGRPALACGAELKNTFCLTRDSHAFLSQHVGDMENEETLVHFQRTLELYQKLFRVQPEIIACDLHPDYLSSRWAEAEAGRRQLPLLPVQHHHAHILSCLADNGTVEPAVGVALDGTGYGSDGKIWGGEFLLVSREGFKRKAHFEYLPLAGGDSAILNPYRLAIGYLYAVLGNEGLEPGLAPLRAADEFEIELIKKQIDQGLNTPLTSSCGRLFDFISALAGLRSRIEYEGQAAIDLEMAAGDAAGSGSYPFGFEIRNGVRLIRLKDLILAVLGDIKGNLPIAQVSLKFHNTMVQIIVETCRQICGESGLRRVALSGGVFQNRRLLGQAVEALQTQGLEVLAHSKVPCNDGGISLGQAVAANLSKAVN